MERNINVRRQSGEDVGPYRRIIVERQKSRIRRRRGILITRDVVPPDQADMQRNVDLILSVRRPNFKFSIGPVAKLRRELASNGRVDRTQIGALKLRTTDRCARRGVARHCNAVHKYAVITNHLSAWQVRGWPRWPPAHCAADRTEYISR